MIAEAAAAEILKKLFGTDVETGKSGLVGILSALSAVIWQWKQRAVVAVGAAAQA